MSELEFIEYFLSFYGTHGLYPQSIPNLSTNLIKAGMFARGKAFAGDSFDREFIRDMIRLHNGLDCEWKIPQAQLKRFNSKVTK